LLHGESAGPVDLSESAQKEDAALVRRKLLEWKKSLTQAQHPFGTAAEFFKDARQRPAGVPSRDLLRGEARVDREMLFPTLDTTSPATEHLPFAGACGVVFDKTPTKASVQRIHGLLKQFRFVDERLRLWQYVPWKYCDGQHYVDGLDTQAGGNRRGEEAVLYAQLLEIPFKKDVGFAVSAEADRYRFGEAVLRLVLARAEDVSAAHRPAILRCAGQWLANMASTARAESATWACLVHALTTVHFGGYWLSQKAGATDARKAEAAAWACTHACFLREISSRWRFVDRLDDLGAVARVTKLLCNDFMKVWRLGNTQAKTCANLCERVLCRCSSDQRDARQRAHDTTQSIGADCWRLYFVEARCGVLFDEDSEAWCIRRGEKTRIPRALLRKWRVPHDANQSTDEEASIVGADGDAQPMEQRPDDDDEKHQRVAEAKRRHAAAVRERHFVFSQVSHLRAWIRSAASGGFTSRKRTRREDKNSVQLTAENGAHTTIGESRRSPVWGRREVC
jgi:hypothetical protein